VYGKHVLLPIEFQIKTFRNVVQAGMNLDEAQQQILLHINEMDEIKQEALPRTTLIQEKRTKWHDKYLKKKKIQPRDWALLYEEIDPGGYWWPPTFSKWLKTVFWPFWQFTIFSRF
jgi:hypothetical protein